METIGLFIATFLFVYWVIWFVIELEYKRIIKKAENRIKEIFQTNGVLVGRVDGDFCIKRDIPHVPTSNRLNFNENKHESDCYNLPLTSMEEHILAKSTVCENQIRDWQYFLNRKLTYSELLILELTSNHAIPIDETYFKP